MAHINTVIFDLDGTLLNTLDDLADAVNYALAQYGYPVRPLAEIREFVGNGVRNLLERSVPGGLEDPKYEACLGTFQDYYSQNMQKKTCPYQDIPELLEKLTAAGMKMAIVSNKFDKAVKELNRQYFGDCIGVAIGESARIHKKPAPDCVFEAMQELHADAHSAIYVGDSEVDVRTARNAGIPCVGVTWGFRDKEILEKEEAEYIIEHPMELMDVLEEIEKSRSAE